MGIVNVSHGKVRSRAQTGESLMVLDSIPTKTKLFVAENSAYQVEIESPSLGTFWEITSYDEDIWVKFGTNPVADETSSVLITAGSTRNFAVSSSNEKVSIKTVSGYTENLNLNFQSSKYTLQSGYYTDPTSIPGWAFSRPGYNLLLRSQDLSVTWNPVTGAGSSIIRTANAETAPDGTLSATRLQFTTSNFALVQQSVTVTSGQIFTLSIWLKSLGTDTTISIGDGVLTPFTVTQSWQRFVVTLTSSSTTLFFKVNASSNCDIAAWGAQIEPGSVVGGYQPTTTTAITSGVNISYAEGLVDDISTNYNPNSTSAGAIVGTSTLPSNWGFSGGATAGLTVTVVNTGIENDLSYVDVRLNGTTNTNAATMTFSSTSAIQASPFHTWTASIYYKMIAGSTTNITDTRTQVIGIGGSAGTGQSNNFLPTSTIIRPSVTYTLGTGATNVRQGLAFIFVNGAAVDITLRIYQPQLESRSTVSIPIVTTTGPVSAVVGRIQGLVPFGPNQPRITERGLLVEEARTNKVTINNANPTNTSGLIVSIGTPTVTVVDDAAALATAGLSAAATSGKVYRIQGVNGDLIIVSGQAGNTNTHVPSVYARGSGNAVFFSNGAARGSITLGAGYVRSVGSAFSPISTSQLGIILQGSTDMYLILPQLELGSFPTSPIVTTSAAATRAADNASVTGLSGILGQFRTNLVIRSQEFNNAVWSKTQIGVSADVIAAPDDTMTADGVVPNAVVATHAIATAPTYDGTQVLTFSVYAKAGAYNTFSISNGVQTQGVDVNLSTQAKTNIGSATTTITDVGNGWYRVAVTFAANTLSGLIYLFPNSRGAYAGDGVTVGTYLWGAQLETGATATAYIPTTTAAASAGNPVTLVAWADFVAQNGVSQRMVSANDGTVNNVIQLAKSTGNALVGQVVTGGTIVTSGGPTVSGPQVSKQALRARAAAFTEAANGALYGPLSSGAPTVNRLDLGAQLGAAYLNGYIQRVQILGDTTDSQLLKLST